MVTIGDFATNLRTGKSGQVIGYGHEMSNAVYQTTLKVLIAPDHAGHSSQIEEDQASRWRKLEENQASRSARSTVA
jgi:hypothetical protein